MAPIPGYAMFIPSAIRKAVDLPVVGVGRFKDPLQAERALSEGHCDLVGVVRGQIADADFVAKARAGATDETRLCLSCNQECVGRMGLNRWLGCIENPRTGREAEGVGTVRLTSKPKSVMVVGAGPAGLQAAIAARRNGHQVTVYEKEPQAGGQVQGAAGIGGRQYDRACGGDGVQGLGPELLRHNRLAQQITAGGAAAALVRQRLQVDAGYVSQ